MRNTLVILSHSPFNNVLRLINKGNIQYVPSQFTKYLRNNYDQITAIGVLGF